MAQAATIAQLNIAVLLEFQKMQAQFVDLKSKVSAGNKRVTDTVNSQWAGVTDNIKKQLTSLIPAVTIAGVAAFGKSLIDNASQLNDAANAAQMDVEAYQVLAHEAKQTGADIQQLNNAHNTLVSKLEDASRGSKEAQRSFEDLGLDYKQIRSLAPEMQFEAIGRAILQANDPLKAQNAAMELLGTKNAPKLLEVLRKLGDEGFQKVKKDAEESGVVLGKYYVKQLDDAGDRIETFWTRVKNSATIALSDLININSQGLFERLPVWMGGHGVLSTNTALSEEALQAIKDEGKEAQQNALFQKAADDARAIRLEHEKQLLSQIGQSSGRHTSTGAGTAGYEAALAYQQKLDGLKQKESDLNKQIADYQLSQLQPAQQIVELEEKLAIAKAKVANAPDRRNASEYAAWIQDSKDLLAVQQQLDEAYKKFNDDRTKVIEESNKENEEAWKKSQEAAEKFNHAIEESIQSMSSSLSSAAADALMTGEDLFSTLRDMIVKAALQTALQLAVINPVINGIFGSLFSGFTSLPSLFGGFAIGGYGEGLRMVGEQGPELLDEKTGIVIPAGMTRTMTSGSSGGGASGASYYIDARGADAAQMAQLRADIKALNGTVNERSVYSNLNAMRRRGTLGRALAGG